MPVLPVHILIDVLKGDPTLQNNLNSEAWNDLDDLHERYRSSTLDRRGLVDGLCLIVGKNKLLATVQAAALEHAGATSPLKPSKRRMTPSALPRHLTAAAGAPFSTTPSPASSVSSSSPSTPGSSEVAAILTKQVRATAAAGATRSDPLAAGSRSDETVRILVHAFHCRATACPVAKCQRLKHVLVRMEGHVSQCLSMRTPLGAPTADCKTCRLWRALDRTRHAATDR